MLLVYKPRYHIMLSELIYHEQLSTVQSECILCILCRMCTILIIERPGVQKFLVKFSL